MDSIQASGSLITNPLNRYYVKPNNFGGRPKFKFVRSDDVSWGPTNEKDINT